MSDNIKFALPVVILNFIFDLHDATRRSMRVEEVQPLYEQKFKEISDKYFAHASWPLPEDIASECGNDAVFLLFYKELTFRHHLNVVNKSPGINEYVASWQNYKQLFNVITSSSFTMSPQWAFDIMQEFVYQFQSFCQVRSKVDSRSQEELILLETHVDSWSLPAVSAILQQLLARGATSGPESVQGLLGYFGKIELLRLECIVGDYSSSLKAVEGLNSLDASELFYSVPAARIDLFYHRGVSLIMMRQYEEAVDAFSSIVIFVVQLLKPGNISGLSKSILSQFQKLMDKASQLVALCLALNPGMLVEDRVMDEINNKFSDKARRMAAGDIAAFQEIFEQACPKFVFAGVPDYSAPVNCGQEAYKNQINLFMNEVKQRVPVLKLGSILKLYTSVELDKLARFNDVSEAVMVNRLLAYKHKLGSASLDYHIEGNNLIVDTTISGKSDGGAKACVQFFMSGIRKNAELTKDINKVFGKYNL